ncbi:hypothetical protein CJ030_MR1G027724 [Morella rubra]|uniref:Uncharacterized protein n=1 Tax=Morella rubra TaxID=262757 RepID=A0A6A1WPF5_9ROSI|nr:hypothetical protein CJ030_MR1G027724 [Morella rubra]
MELNADFSKNSLKLDQNSQTPSKFCPIFKAKNIVNDILIIQCQYNLLGRKLRSVSGQASRNEEHLTRAAGAPRDLRKAVAGMPRAPREAAIGRAEADVGAA